MKNQKPAHMAGQKERTICDGVARAERTSESVLTEIKSENNREVSSERDERNARRLVDSVFMSGVVPESSLNE
jgi:hypothetical protein